MLTRIPVAHQLLGAAVEVLFRATYAFLERPRCRLVQYLYAGTQPLSRLYAVECGVFIRPSRRYGPHLSRRQRINADAVFGLKFWGGDEALYPVYAKLVAEMRVPERAGATPVPA